MPRPTPLSGFPEFLPAQALVEQQFITVVRETFEVHGFGRIETRAVEPLDQLNRKGEITKEVYVVRRLHAAADDAADMGLHFDLTVPFARYVLENAGKLVFPFRRYQIQKAWRGERPQEGRYREFCQADIDIVGQGTLAAHHEAEVVLAALDVFARLHEQMHLPPVLLRVNNRKLTQGFYEGLGVTDPLAVTQRVDKLNKIGRAGVADLLSADCGLSPEQIDRVLALAQIRASDDSFVSAVRALGVGHPQLDEGLAELTSLLAETASRFPDRVIADLSIARGLDYYTGAVFEAELVGYESLGTIAAGGRYDSLASDGKVSFPGVGISLGITRTLAPLLAKGVLTASRSVPSVVLVAVDDEAVRSSAVEVATRLRRRGIAVEVAAKADKFGKQIRAADRRGIPFVWFGGVSGQVKDLRSGDQTDAEADSWQPPVADLTPGVLVP